MSTLILNGPAVALPPNAAKTAIPFAGFISNSKGQPLVEFRHVVRMFRDGGLSPSKAVDAARQLSPAMHARYVREGGRL